ncbi:putative repeat protein (TIGR01451 family) [Spirosoma lacussanchae]|uniref:CotH kinase family protein n=1 Tax=Spirosoma lacussanchae TaxID=1884249 RepID=UPI001108E7D2|nr:CotH kinase family protein [Spirosoma lacussanchae]
MTTPSQIATLVVTLLCLLGLQSNAQTLTTSNLPIIIIDTEGQTINDEPGIVTSLSIINNASGINSITDVPNEYQGKAKVEFRGCSSQNFPKKPYGIELRNSTLVTESIDRALFGFPAESDWVLNASYTDKSFVRDPLTYYMANQSGRYASRVKYVELIINGVYQGIYIFQERVKRDANRVNVRSLNPDDTSPARITGGYIVKVDKNCGDFDPNHVWLSNYMSPGGTIPHQWATHYPNDDDITAQQFNYIQGYVDEFETTVNSTSCCNATNGYSKFIVEDTFIDYFLLQEATSNADGFRISAYLSKQRDADGGRLSAGPAWDFNLAYGFLTTPFDGNAQTYEGWRYTAPGDGNFPVPFWWARLLTCCQYANKLVTRYKQLRQTVWQTSTLLAYVDAQYALLNQGSLNRNFTKWPILGVQVWNDQPSYVGATQLDEVNQVKTWLTNRLAWMDAHINSLLVEPLATGTLSTTASAIGQGQTAQLTLAFTGSGPWSYTLSPGLSGSAVSSPVTLTVQPTATTTYTLTAIRNGCGTGTASGTAVITVLMPADLSLAFSSDRRTASVGEPIQLQLALTNSSPESVSLVQLENRLPPNLIFTGSPMPGVTAVDDVVSMTGTNLAAGQTMLFSYTVQATAEGTFRNAAQIISASQPDADSQPNSGTGDGQDDMAETDLRVGSSVSLFVSANPNQTPLPPVLSNQPPTDPNQADISLALVSSQLAVLPDQPFSLSLVISNRGGAAASNVAVQTELPAGWQLTSNTGLTVSGQVVSGTVPSLGANAQTTVVLPLQASMAGTVQAQIQSSTPTDPDSTPGNGYANGEDDTASLTLRVR